MGVKLDFPNEGALMEFENRALRIFRPKRDEVTG
jgi:hypothetical protein